MKPSEIFLITALLTIGIFCLVKMAEAIIKLWEIIV